MQRAIVQEKAVTKKIVLALVLGTGVLGISSAIYAAPDKPKPASHAPHVTHDPDQIPAPPHPPRTKPLQRVIVRSS